MEFLLGAGVALLSMFLFACVGTGLWFGVLAIYRRIKIRNIIVKATYKQAKYINEILKLSSDSIIVKHSRCSFEDWVDKRVYFDSDDDKKMLFVNFKDSRKQLGITFVGFKAIVFIKEEDQRNSEASDAIYMPLYHSVKIWFFLLKKLRSQKYANVNKKKEEIDNKIFNIYTESIE